jgi:cytochrome c-type biogenesis protein CcmH
MTKWHSLIALSVLICWFGVSNAQDVYSFQSTQQRQQFTELTHQFRCLVCQNEDLDASSAPLALDLKNKIYTMVQAGQPNQEIIDYMVSRYGDFVLFKPVVDTRTMPLWYGPFLLLMGGFVFVWCYIKRCGKKVS